MADAADKAEQASPQGEAQKSWAQQAKDRNKKNQVVKSWYELAAGHKVSLCKKKASGSVYRTYIGSINDKEHGPALKKQIEDLQKKNQLKTRV